eukprot:gene5675-3533_t
MTSRELPRLLSIHSQAALAPQPSVPRMTPPRARRPSRSQQSGSRAQKQALRKTSPSKRPSDQTGGCGNRTSDLAIKGPTALLPSPRPAALAPRPHSRGASEPSRRPPAPTPLSVQPSRAPTTPHTALGVSPRALRSLALGGIGPGAFTAFPAQPVFGPSALGGPSLRT